MAGPGRPFTERDMADAFEASLRNQRGPAGFPRFTVVFREVACRQGVPDLVAASGQLPCCRVSAGLREAARFSAGSTISLLALLKRSAPRSLAYLREASGLSRRTAARALSCLVDVALARPCGSGLFTLAAGLDLPSMDLWAFELKLTNWRRALFQALQNMAFARRTFAVFPSERERVLGQHIPKFRLMNVGVMLFGLHDHSHRVLVRPRSSRPLSRAHYLSACAQIARLADV